MLNKNYRIGRFFIFILSVFLIFSNCKAGGSMNNGALTDEERYVIVDKGTERPFTGKYNDHFEKGTYICKRCGAHLYRSENKFRTHCGWPSFDDEIKGAVKRIADADGIRTEIQCSKCGAHLGHVFLGEGLTLKNTRHCVNSISMLFIADSSDTIKKAVFAAGCFWGVEFYFKKLPGVISVVSGYTGGKADNPAYDEVCSGKTGHAEAVEVHYDSEKISFENLVKYFFEIHDFTQINRQGPDIGEQYRTEIFYETEDEKIISEKIILILQEKGYAPATKITRAGKFWKAEDYHQNYYQKNGKQPYCHTYKKIF